MAQTAEVVIIGGGIVGASIAYRLLLDSRVVDLPLASNPTLVILSSLKSLFFNSLKNDHASQTPLEHKTPESNKSEI